MGKHLQTVFGRPGKGRVSEIPTPGRSESIKHRQCSRFEGGSFSMSLSPTITLEFLQQLITTTYQGAAKLARSHPGLIPRVCIVPRDRLVQHDELVYR